MTATPGHTQPNRGPGRLQIGDLTTGNRTLISSGNALGPEQPGQRNRWGDDGARIGGRRPRQTGLDFSKDSAYPFVEHCRKSMGAEHDEREGIRLSREGRAEAFSELIRQHQRMIHSLTYRMTGSLAEAEDLAQDTFLRAWQHLDSFQGEAKFSTWLCRIAMNTCLNWRRREGRRNEVQQTWANDAQVDGAPHPAPAPASELNQRVQAALNRLPVKQRAAIVLTIHEEMNHAEAAHALGCSEATISWRLFAARTKLKRWLKTEVIDE